jgi:hypothetical protein
MPQNAKNHDGVLRRCLTRKSLHGRRSLLFLSIPFGLKNYDVLNFTLKRAGCLFPLRSLCSRYCYCQPTKDPTFNSCLIPMATPATHAAPVTTGPFPVSPVATPTATDDNAFDKSISNIWSLGTSTPTRASNHLQQDYDQTSLTGPFNEPRPIPLRREGHPSTTGCGGKNFFRKSYSNVVRTGPPLGSCSESRLFYQLFPPANNSPEHNPPPFFLMDLTQPEDQGCPPRRRHVQDPGAGRKRIGAD